MITKIEVNNAVMFNDNTPAIDDLRTFNYFFGANGTGKTTISKIIEDATTHPGCSLQWANGNAMDTLVYNRDFVERNFNPQVALKGVFTLGEQEADVFTRIQGIKADIDSLDKDISSRTATLQGEDGSGGKKKELSDLTDTYAERFFAQKRKHNEKLAGGMRGHIGSKSTFMHKVLAEASDNNSDLKTLEELETKAATVFSDTLIHVASIDLIQWDNLLRLEENPILAKRIIGKDDVNIAAIIKKLGNSDWVRQGRSYYEANDGICPFCQQRTDNDFEKNLNDYFDDTFERDIAVVNELLGDCESEYRRVLLQIQAIIDLHTEFIDNNKLETEKQLLERSIAINMQKLTQKQKESSRVFKLDSLQCGLESIASLIAAANTKIAVHNAVVDNIDAEKGILTGRIWRYIVEELKDDINDYNTCHESLSAAIDSLGAQLQAKKSEKSDKLLELKELEKQSANIHQTLDGINNILTSFGFRNFWLDEGNDAGTYKLVRANGDDAQTTLSEGEKNFVTFLYFYHLLRGSQSETGLSSDRVVVFDDPVSSLDSDILFIVSSLIRELIEEVRQGGSAVKQIFVLTHNVYFHKELTYNSRRTGEPLNEETFWLIRKRDTLSSVERQNTNPIKTSYQLLWDEVRSERRNNATIQNTLRRILESYFKLLGGKPVDKLYLKFDGDDRIKCKDLCSWINDGSHNGGIFSDEYYTIPDDSTVEKYLKVFKEIFEKCEHPAHYNMMMGIEYEAEQKEEPANG